MSCYLQHIYHCLWDNNFYTTLFPNTGRREKTIQNVRNSYIIHYFPYSYTLLFSLIVEFNFFEWSFISFQIFLVLKHLNLLQHWSHSFDKHRVGMISVLFLCVEKKQKIIQETCAVTQLTCFIMTSTIISWK